MVRRCRRPGRSPRSKSRSSKPGSIRARNGPMISREKLSYHRLTQRPDGSWKRFAVAIGKRSEKMLRQDSTATNRRGPGGSTPLMYAALYGDADSVRLLLNHGADPNIRNDAGATALMWAVEDPEKIRLLLQHGANVDARSADGQTPLIIAAGRYGSAVVVKLLLDGGANPSEKASDGRTPLDAAAFAADDVAIQMLIDHGAEVQAPAYASARP